MASVNSRTLSTGSRRRDVSRDGYREGREQREESKLTVDEIIEQLLSVKSTEDTQVSAGRPVSRPFNCGSVRLHAPSSLVY